MTKPPYRFKQNTTSFAYYWQKGIGKKLLSKIGYTPTFENAEELLPLLFQWDKEGDQVVIDLYQETDFQSANKSLEQYLLHENINPRHKQIWANFFNKIDLEPKWLNKEKLKLGSELCRRSGLTALIVLRDYCLMGGYESAAINKPLIYTGALKKGAVKRLSETLEFWVQITRENGLEYGTEGFKQIFLTRMIHSYSRVNILEKTDWDMNKWGVPLNTWDMIATNLGFSLVFLVGLCRIAIEPSQAEIDGLFHFWKYVGHLLGIPSHLLPDTEEQAIHALYLWTMTQREADEDSKALAIALKEEPIQAKYPKNPLYRKMMREIHLYYNHFLLSDYSCRQLGLPKTTIGRFGIINIWKAKQLEERIIDQNSRNTAIKQGGDQQERVRQIYQQYNS